MVFLGLVDNKFFVLSASIKIATSIISDAKHSNFAFAAAAAPRVRSLAMFGVNNNGKDDKLSSDNHSGISIDRFVIWFSIITFGIKFELKNANHQLTLTNSWLFFLSIFIF